MQVGKAQVDRRETVGDALVAGRELGGVLEVKDRLVVRKQPPRPLAGADQVVDRLRSGLAQVEVARKEIDDLVAGSVHRLRDLRDLPVQVTAPPSQEA